MRAKGAGAEAIICASTGNTSASAAAYGAAHGLEVVVVLPSGKIAMGKLSQAIAHGATLLQVEDRVELRRELGQDRELRALRELRGSYAIVGALSAYANAVRARTFPDAEHSY